MYIHYKSQLREQKPVIIIKEQIKSFTADNNNLLYSFKQKNNGVTYVAYDNVDFLDVFLDTGTLMYRHRDHKERNNVS